jgi:ubiquinone/menaquinone biosynthesis C-methylase UbiE
MSTIQGTAVCAAMVEAFNKKRILEVACGPGRHSHMLATGFMRPKNSVLVSCDFSQQMIQSLKKMYESDESDFSLVPGNKYLIEDHDEYL